MLKSKGKRLVVEWIYEDQIVARQFVSVGGDNWRTWVRHRVSAKRYPAGRLNVVVQARFEDGPPLNSVEITLVGPCAKTHDCER